MQWRRGAADLGYVHGRSQANDFDLNVKSFKLDTEVLAFKGKLPAEYSSTKLPLVFVELNAEDFVIKVASSGDVQLKMHVANILSHRGVLNRAFQMSLLRGSPRRLGQAGGKCVLDDQHVGLVSQLRRLLADATLRLLQLTTYVTRLSSSA